MTRRRRVHPSLALLWPAVLGGQVPGPSFRDVIGLESVGAPAISPDGKSVAYTVRTTDWSENRFDTEVWVRQAGAEPVQLTRTAKGSSSSPRWSADGKWIAFLADRGERQQVYVIRAAGGEAVKLTSVKEGILDFRWSPAGDKIAFTSLEPESAASIKSRSLYGDFYFQDHDYRISHLWVIAVDPSRSATDSISAASPTRLTGGTRFTVGSFAWSPDAGRIAFDHRPDPLVRNSAASDISLVDTRTGTVTPLVNRSGTDFAPVWSPDGDSVAFISSAGDTVSNSYRNSRLVKISATGGEPILLATDVDESIGPFSWTPHGLWFLAFTRTRSSLIKVDPVTGRAESDTRWPFLAIGGAIPTPDGSWWGVVAQKDAASLPEVYRVDITRPATPERLTDMTSQLAHWNLGTSEVVRWASRDGTVIEGVLRKPRDYQSGKRYPLFVVLHGGPANVDWPQPVPFSPYPMVQWIARGALILQPNYRGSAGYGERFRSLNVRNLGVGDMWDVMSGVDTLIRSGMVDSSRMGAMGWSQGGYISAFLTTHTSRFKAISVGAGISNWVTYYVATNFTPFTLQYLKANPWDDFAIYQKTSPMTTIKQARTPTLIQHGQFDQTVPIQNAYELYRGLLDQGVPTELVIYRGFGHGINRPKEHLAALWHNWQWFGRYVFGEEVAIPLEEAAVPRGDR